MNIHLRKFSYNNTGVKGTDVYSRTNKVFGLSLNYHF